MIQHKTIDGLLLRDMVVAGAALLEKNREAVDALNVFPVPDGDTGTNMSLTMQSATREVNAQEYLRAEEAAAAISKGGLKGARGKSGVITSELLRGFGAALVLLLLSAALKGAARLSQRSMERRWKGIR